MSANLSATELTAKFSVRVRDRDRVEVGVRVSVRVRFRVMVIISINDNKCTKHQFIHLLTAMCC